MYVRDPHEPGVVVGGVEAVPGDVVCGQGVVVHKPTAHTPGRLAEEDSTTKY